MSTIGTTAPSQHTINYNDLLSTTLFNYRSTIFDNIFKQSAYMAALKTYGGVDYQNGGERIQRLLMYETNSTAKSYRGYDIIDTTPQDGFTSAFYEWCELAATISISRREKRQNSSEWQIADLLKAKIKQAEMSLKQAVNQQLVQGTVYSGGTTFIPGNDSKDLFPLGYFLAAKTASADGTLTDPLSGGNVGNISRSTYSWWRHNTGSGGATAAGGEKVGAAATTYKGLERILMSMYNYCTRGADGSAPNIILTDQLTYETYSFARDQKYQTTDLNLAQMGFDNVKLKAATVVWDELVPDMYSGTTAVTYGTAFFINTEFYKLVIDKETDFTTTPFLENEQQTADSAKILFMGNATSTNQRKHGVLYRLNQAIVS